MEGNTTNYSAKHPDYLEYEKKWTVIEDVLKGEFAIKAKKTIYLPLANVERSTEEYNERYNAYLERAKFYNATARTLSGFVGQVFNKPPSQEIDSSVEYFKEDPCGTGVTLEQLAKGVLAKLVSTGRCGIWVDFPKTNGSYTKAEVDAGLTRPTLTLYDAKDIINWRTIKRGARTILSLVVLHEKVLIEDDDFVSRYGNRYRVLRLRNNVYTVEVFDDWQSVSHPVVIPLDNNGNKFDEIQFFFGGINENDYTVDEPPMFDMASLNIAHYRNSADYEEACFMVGQPTVWYAGLDKNWIDNVLKGEFRLGSRGGLPLPMGGSAGILQVQANGLAKEAMDQKEQQMVALGARIVKDSSVAKTATEINSDKITEVSTLAAGARNTSALLRTAFNAAQKFAGTNVKIGFELATDFDMARMTSQELLAIVTVWQSGLMATVEARDVLTRAGYTTLSLEEAIKAGAQAQAPVATTPATRTDNRSSQNSSGSV